MATKLASTGNGRNPMALVTSCGMSRENKIEFSGMRHTRNPAIQETTPARHLCDLKSSAPSGPDRTQHQRPSFQGGGTSPMSHSSHSTPRPPFVKTSQGITREGPLQQDGTGLGSGKTPTLSTQAPKVASLSELHSGWEQGCPSFP